MIREYSKYKPFRFWCQKVLPLVYDDSLSYYELLNKVVDYLNNVIKDVNALGTAFEELDAMVNDYFDNLDVQEEINNKLDSMAEDGTLDAMILPLVGDAVSEWLEDNVTPTGSAVLIDKTLTISDAAADAKVVGDRLFDKAPVIVESASGEIATFNDGADGYPVKKLEVEIEPVQSGSGNPSPDNVRPITGWTGAHVQRTGKNLFNVASIEHWNVSPTNPDFLRWGNRFNIAGTYAVSAQNAVGFLYCRIMNTDNTIKTTYNIVTGDTINITTFTISEGEWFYVYDALDVNIESATNNFNRWLCQVELGTESTPYEPYNGQSIPIDWTTEVGTIYGGALNVTTGVLTVDRAIVDLGTLTWSVESSPGGDNFYSNILSDAKSPSLVLCSNFASVSTTTSSRNNAFISGTKRINITADGYNGDTIAFTAAMNGVQLVYLLASPITYQLTPIEVKTLLGTNNIFGDTGAVDVEYCADTKMYIDTAIATAIATI